MRYHNITKDDMKNGDGLRAVLWLAGCPHRCPGCHNPVTWDENGGLEFDGAAEKEIFDQLEKSYISGLTLSGGDPLYPGSRKDVEALLIRVKERFPQKTVWLYTGYLWEDICGLALFKHVDVCVDGRFEESLKDQRLLLKGRKNQRVIDVKKTLAQEDTSEAVLYCSDYMNEEETARI